MRLRCGTVVVTVAAIAAVMTGQLHWSRQYIAHVTSGAAMAALQQRDGSATSSGGGSAVQRVAVTPNVTLSAHVAVAPGGRARHDPWNLDKSVLSAVSTGPQQATQCPESVTFRDTALPHARTLLFSFEGSGNTWARYLLEAVTGTTACTVKYAVC